MQNNGDRGNYNKVVESEICGKTIMFLFRVIFKKSYYSITIQNLSSF